MSLFKPRVTQRSFLLAVILATAKMLLIVLLIVGVSATGVLMGIAKAWVETAPALDISSFDAQAKTSFIYDKYGTLITDFKGTENRIDATWNEIPDNLKNAVIAIEDQRFYTHNGVDIKRILGALLTNVITGRMQGGSTITQQLVKKAMLTSDQNYKRKLQEAYLALELETQLSKEEILLEYLNIIYLGGSNYGVKVAAQDYFGKSVSELSLRECAALARTIRDPYKYNARSNYYTRNTPEVIEDNTDYVLRQMYQQGLITQEERDAALAERLTVMEKSAYASTMYDNAYYVEYAIYDVVTKMLRVEGLTDTQANRSAMESKLRTGGYQIFTCLDPELQKSVQGVVTNWKNYPATRNSADSVYKASLGDGEYLQVAQPQASAAVLDWSTGELLAIVGGRAEPLRRKQLNRAYQKPMPVGSSIKPLSIYGPAFDLGYSPGSPVVNAPLRIDGWDSPKGYPGNFSGASFTGVESMRFAIMKSHNTAAAQALYTYVGIENSVNYLLKLGVDREHISATGAGLALGASGISVIEMAGAFGAIANKGRYLEPYAFTRVLNSDGSAYIEVQQQQVRRQAFKESTAYLLVDVMKGCVSNQGTGAQAKFGDVNIVGKTGTNSDYRGVFFAGMSGYCAGAVWIGCDTYKPLTSNATGGSYAAPLWSAIMSKVHSLKGWTAKKAIIPGSASDYGLVKAECCAVSGMKPTRACREDANGYGVTTDYYLKGTEPTESCNMHRTIELCAVSRKAPTSACKTVKTYGTIYLPEGHPLRYADFDTVRQYFRGASTDKTETTIGYCTECQKKAKKSTDKVDGDTYDRAVRTAENLIMDADVLLSTGNLSNAQYKKLNNLRNKTQSAIDNESYQDIKLYGKQLQQYIKKVG